MTGPPTGTVAFLFTDIEGSTRLWEKSPQAMSVALARHDEILREAMEAHGGFVFKTVGDAFCCAFSTVRDALEAALGAQRALFSEEWGEEVGTLQVRMALHTGAAEERGGDYFGPPVNRVARLLSAGHGGQILLSLATQELVRDDLPDDAELRDLGERRLKDLFRPERIFQLVVPDLPSAFPPLKALDTRANNLPAQPTPLVGREREVSEVSSLLRRPEVRLLTLTGPGGTGKTRLALQTAAELVDEFESGVFLVTLAPITDAELVASTIAGSLGVVETGERSPAEDLKDFLRAREILLLLDNFEQVAAAAPLVGELLSACPRLKVLATSRALLGVYGEREYPVPPLSLPDPGRLPPIKTLTQYEAVRLFIERAQAAKADFSVTNENAPAVAEICVRLDGLPLAIELAAARIKLLPPRKMLERLDSRLKLLRGGARDLPARQQTLRGAIDWSHDLLDGDERTLFRRLSVFAGGCTIEAAETVCDADGELGVDVLDGVESLMDNSLLRQTEVEGREPRISMLQTIREYASERLEESEEAAAVMRAHAEHYLALAEEAEPELVGPQQQAWLDVLEEEHDNMRAALSFSLESGDHELALRLGGALWWFWRVRAHLREGSRWLEEALSSRDGTRDLVRAKALKAAGGLAEVSGDFKYARELLEESLALYRLLGDREGMVAPLYVLGWVAMNEGYQERAKTLLQESLELSRETGDKREIATVLHMLGTAVLDDEDPGQAWALFDESEALYREVDDTQGLTGSLNSQGLLARYQGDFARARALFEEAMALSQTIGDTLFLAGCRHNLGWVALLDGDHERARTLIEDGLKIGLESGTKWAIADGLEGLAAVAGAEDKGKRAARLFGAAEALREALGIPLPPADLPLHERHVDAARAGMDAAVWRRAWEEGRTMALEDAVAYALKTGAADGRTEKPESA